MVDPSSSPSGPSLKVERAGNLLILQINRPHVRNAIDGPTAEAINAAMDEIEADPDIFMGIITGAGGCFSAGADLKAMAVGGTSGTSQPRGSFGICARPPEKPLIAAIEGVAVGGGMEIALSCDLIVAARDARLGLPEVKRNLLATGGGLLRLPRRIPYNLAVEVALSGELYPAEFFHRHGLINRLSEPGNALADAVALATTLMENGPTALAATVSIMRRARNWTFEEGLVEQRVLGKRALESQDRQEGVRAFLDKRQPVWTGR